MSVKGTFTGFSLPIHNQLAELWRRFLFVQVPSIDSSFFELGGDTERAAQMLEELKGLTNGEVSLEMFVAAPSIRGLTTALLASLGHEDLFACIQPGNGETPFYFFHGDILGGGFYSRRLAALLGPERPVFVSAPIKLNADLDLPSLEDIASRKRHALEARQPDGPYLLGGFCVGAVVAYEVARQLEANGKEVGTVILIEPETGDAVTRSHLRMIDRVAARTQKPLEKVKQFIRGQRKIERVRHVLRSPWHEKKEFMVRNGRKLLGGPVAEADRAAADVQEHANGNGDSWLLPAYQWILTSYRPRKFNGPVKLLLTDESQEDARHVVREWRKAAPQTEVDRIPGSHLGCITTHIESIAAKVRAELNALKSLVGAWLPAASEFAWIFEH